MVSEAEMGWNGWRVLRWGIAAALLTTPAVMMQISDEWNWGPASFVLAGVMICGPILVYERTSRIWPSLAYRGGAAVAMIVSFLLIWINLAVGIVGEDNPVNFNFFMLIFASAVGAFAARFRPDGMARAMLGTAAVQVLLAIAIATAPSTQREPGGGLSVLVLCGFFAAMWLVSAALFHKASKEQR
ncbi:MAG TPA: hypothetical protein VJM13_02130 [Sphingopyxis sp.]|nr:hypothetical protein [Sphingopyxis sp.]